MSNMEKELHMSNTKLGWFEFKLGKTKRKLEAANLWASKLGRVIRDQDIAVELLKEVMTWAEDDATDWGIDVSFKIFKRLSLELHPDFDMKLLEAHLSDEIIHEAMDKVEREKATAGLSGSSPAELPVVVRVNSGEED